MMCSKILSVTTRMLFCSVILGCLATPTSAHKVNLFAYVEGNTVHTESYFPDGRPVAGGKIEVYDGEENKLLEGFTDENGFFSFEIPEVDRVQIVLHASMGHRATATLAAEELGK